MPSYASRPEVRQRPIAGGGAADARTPRGVTLPEIMVVMAIVAVVGAMAIPRFDLVRYRMDGAARGTATALVAAQRMAVKRQHDVVVAFDVANGLLRIHQDEDNDGEIDPGESIRRVPLGENVEFGVGGATPLVAGGEVPVGFTGEEAGLRAVRFIRNGSASEEGELYLTSTRALTRDEGRYTKDARALKVDRATGRISWYHFEDSKWTKGF